VQPVREDRRKADKLRSSDAESNNIQNIVEMTKKEFSFNQAVNEIEKILKEIETGEMDVDRLSAEVRKASELIRQCQKKLKTTEEEINNIFRDLS
jgi:exodeoxyribonuclease VII small subunit